MLPHSSRIHEQSSFDTDSTFGHYTDLDFGIAILLS